ncbi:MULTISPECIES: ABC transporter permease subunit [unclassified Rhizobium]|uniref:ABC transporter permease n=1 Tax=unclassified Rhizobium TaxID=2613769 RepID=UPI000DE0AAC6|nr:MULTISPECIES: ABC transporter permease subunit [unclassified Rhizobium]MBB3285828.1 putative spermidine/putrescine transport system permease protein [Rhizobium sp. BK252]MBB3401010.1 putative spermidine/putrescine transport system permease protein [Rhizobium sp. BK289]MBB3413146.1 putative spermidine/putrescine transport system permease protein [Rhizobium sp. BK284]MBB3481476.1 putative spermidine/putrescine transport system permease protein [Rhizobium sp. BK347]MDK4723306.1 ABC transporter
MSTVTTSTMSTTPLINKRLVVDWLGIAPFLIFALLFLILPTIYLIAGAFLTPDGSLTLKNIGDLFTKSIMDSYWISIKVSVTSALGGALIGFYLAWALVMGGLPAWVRNVFLTFSGVASNFAGVPLAFAFIATIGRLGLVTVLMRDWLGFNLYATGFNLYSFIGLTVTYMYFQIPLMVLIITPALDGMKKEWREAASILGATNRQYWLMVALPILWPSLLGTTLLLFANAFGAIATAIALTGSSLNIIPIQLYAQIRGDVLHNANLGYAMALGMIVITGISNVIYIIMRIRAERWQK